MATKWTERISMFRSARLKLTLFYLGILVLLNLSVTLSVRVYAEHEFLLSNNIQRDEVKRWMTHLFTIRQPHRPDDVFIGIQAAQAEVVAQRLNEGLLVINSVAFIVGGLLSYWFAGRTLRPLQEAHEAQARFTTDASHELRTPLANMRLENEVFLRQKHFTEDEGREQLLSNLEEIQRLERLSNNLLALHEYGGAALRRAPTDITKLVQAALLPVKAAAAVKHVEIIAQDIVDGDVLVHHDSMVQLLDILLDNALKYAAQGRVITVQGKRRASRYMLTVQDKGPGLAAHDIPHLFDRLYRGDKARSNRVSGYGLGLALAREIALANGATITARNNPGIDAGACFEVTMEIAPKATPKTTA